jgi:ATP-dependent helicase HrpB
VSPAPLPIDAHLPEICRLARSRRAVIVVAPPGAGKTTRVPPALAVDGPVIVLQPRRLAARSLAKRIAAEQGWTLGEQAGYHVRFDRAFSRNTRVLVATEGILTARLQSDPLLTEFRTVVLDEFHERSIHADLALAMARQAWLAREDLRLVVMSATIDAEPVARFLDDAPVVRLSARAHPVDVTYAPGLASEQAVLREPPGGGHVLVFLPGAPEIRRTAAALAGRPELRDARVFPLHGRLTADEQDAALAPSGGRKVILATNVAETSLTVEGVTTVIDTGFHKVVRFDPGVGIDRLETERISTDAADQRAGRAGRTAPGRAVRLWDPRDVLRPHREPDIARVDLASPLLDVLAWGGAPERFAWFEPPPPERVASAMTLLVALGAVLDGRITPLGRIVGALPLPPRLARVLIGAGGSPLAAAACAVLSEGFRPRGPLPAAASDVLARADRLRDAPPSVRRAAGEIAESARRWLADPELAAAAAAARVEGDDEDTRILRALYTGFPDRLARRREPGSRRLVLASGYGGELDRDSVVHDGEWLVAVDLEAGRRGPGSVALVRAASRVDRAWLDAPVRRTEHRFDPATGTVRAVSASRIGGLLVAEHAVTPDPLESATLLSEAFIARGVTPEQQPVASRMRFAGVEPDLDAAARAACAGATTLPALDLLGTLSFEARRTVDRLAPATIPLPSGRGARLDYRDDGSVVAAVKLQELFGLAETPRIGARGEAVVFELLAPNGRPVQTTRDLRSFWERTYPEVRRELRGRYPRHPWPEDPWTAPPTHRTKPR